MHNTIKSQTFQATATPKGVNTDIRGKKFGHLVAEYSDRLGRRVFLRCVCKRMIWVAADSLISGEITSCGCQQPTRAYHNQQSRLSRQLIHEMTFGIRHPRHEDKPGRKS